MKEARIALDEQAYRCLVRGGELTVKGKDVEVKIILNDIGFDVMDKVLSEVILGKEKPYEPLVQEE